MDGNLGNAAVGRARASAVGSLRRRRSAPAAGLLAALLATVSSSALFGCRAREAAPAEKLAEPQAAAAAPPSAPPGGTAPAADAPLGLDDLAALAWRERGGQEAFRKARAAERQGDWATMVARCQEALAADPSHLEASWLLAAGLSHLRRFAEVGAPLARAVAGDPGKWAQPALDLALFAPFWESGQGEALRRWISSLPPRVGEALGRAALLGHRGRLVAFDPRERRWYPLGRRLRVAGALPLGTRLVYLAPVRGAGRVRSPEAGGWVLGVVELSSGATREVALPAGQRFEVVEVAAPAAAAGAPGVASSMSGTPSAMAPRLLVRADRGPWQEVSGEQLVAATQVPRVEAPRLILAKGRPQIARLPVAGVVADWDQASMASALRIRRSNKLVAPPAPALIDGQRLQWSPAATRLALVASLEDCDKPAEAASARAAGAPATASRRTLAYVVDPITGAAREVAQSAAGIEVQWVGEQLLAVATERGVELIELSRPAGAPVAAGGDPAAAGGAPSLGPLAAELSLTVPVTPTRCPQAAAANDVVGDAEPPLQPGDDLDDL